MPTPVTPIMIPAPNVDSLIDEGYEVCIRQCDPDYLCIGEWDDGEEEIAEWEPERPDDRADWVLHAKFMDEYCNVTAIWARPEGVV